MISTLFSMRDDRFREFHCRLIPNVPKDTVIGVRTPLLRRYVSSMSQEERRSFLQNLPHRYYEENNIHALILNSAPCSLELLEEFLPYVNNWATCDMLKPRRLTAAREEYVARLRHWMMSKHPYTIRYAVNCMMRDFLEQDFNVCHFDWIDGIAATDYYVKMGIAWYYSEALVKQWEITVKHLANGLPDRWILCKALQKGIESYRLTADQKSVLKQMKENVQ